MPRNITPGQCQLCRKTLSHSGMTPHLRKCATQTAPGEPANGLLISVASPYPAYWIYLETPRTTTLRQMDRFLKKLWVDDGCGHLSSFTGGNRRSCNKKITLEQAILPGEKITYCYDMGDPTHLNIRVMGEVPAGKGMRILARNEPPRISCQKCGDPAANFCSPCEQNEGWQPSVLCAPCTDQHPCGEESLLPVVNSPRTGICGYTGPR